MKEALCGIDCTKCELKDTCSGCAETNGNPFGSGCVIGSCCQTSGYDGCGKCPDVPCGLKEKLISEFNALGIEDMGEVTELNALKGSFINLEYTFPSGRSVKIWDDEKIYLGNQIIKKGSSRCYGLAADENYLMVSEYGSDGSDPVVIIFKRWNQTQ